MGVCVLLTGEQTANYTAVVQNPHLLSAGPEMIELYADASYSCEVGAGAWAFTVPAFPASDAGIELGGSVNRAELFAVVQGLMLTTTVDRGHRPIYVHTDSEFVMRVMRHVSQRTKLPARKSFRSVLDLYTQACDLSLNRDVTTVRRSIGDLHHTACDSVAKQRLRGYCSKEELARTILLKRAEERRTAIVNHMRQVERSFDKLHHRLLKCEMEISALRATAEKNMLEPTLLHVR